MWVLYSHLGDLGDCRFCSSISCLIRARPSVEIIVHVDYSDQFQTMNNSNGSIGNPLSAESVHTTSWTEECLRWIGRTTNSSSQLKWYHFDAHCYLRPEQWHNAKSLANRTCRSRFLWETFNFNLCELNMTKPKSWKKKTGKKCDGFWPSSNVHTSSMSSKAKARRAIPSIILLGWSRRLIPTPYLWALNSDTIFMSTNFTKREFSWPRTS